MKGVGYIVSIVRDSFHKRASWKQENGISTLSDVGWAFIEECRGNSNTICLHSVA